MRSGFLRDDLGPLLGLLPPLLWIGTQDSWLLPRTVLCLLVVLGWQALFARIRRQGMGLHGVVSALLIAAFVPESAPFWELVLGASFGMVMGEAIFGGRGRGFVQPVVLALAFMAFSFADQPWRQGPDLPLVSVVPALLLLLASGQARIGALAGVGIGLVGITALVAPDQIGALASGALVLAVLYLTADPVVSGATPVSRLAYGLLAGGLAALFATSGPGFGALVFATLLAQIFAPLLDHVAIAAHRARMRRRARRLRHA